MVVSKDNIDWSIRENIRQALAVLSTKLRVDDSLPMPTVDGGGKNIKLVGGSSHEKSAMTFGQVLLIQAGLAGILRITEDGENRTTEFNDFRILET